MKKISSYHKISFLWLGPNPGESLKKLFVEFKRLKLIDNNTRFIDLNKAFQGKNLSEIKKKINWIGSFRLLIWTIDRFNHKQFIQDELCYRWSQLKGTFQIKGKEIEINRSSKESHKIMTTLNPPKGSTDIDIFIRNLY